VIVVPYELGRLRDGVGCGPERLLEAGAVEALASAGADVDVEVVELEPRFGRTGSGDEDAGFELMRQVAERVRGARATGAFPVVLSGSCFVAVGVVAGMDEASPAVAWLDAHSDFNDPDSTISGYFDGMGLAVLTGDAWHAMAATVPGHRALPEGAVVLAGARDFDPPEEARLRASNIVQLSPERLREAPALATALGGLDPRPTGVYLHLDLDVLDAATATVNVYAAAGGVDGDELHAAVTTVLDECPVRVVSLTAYDPSFDADGRVPPIALRVLRTVAETLRD
jgi:arginase